MTLVSPTQVPFVLETTPKPGWHKIPSTVGKNQGIPFPMPDSGCSSALTDGHHAGSAPASTWGSVDVPAGPGVGWDIPGAAWTFTGEGEMGRREVVLWVCHPLSIQALPWMGQNEPGHEPGMTQRDKEPPESCSGGHLPLEWPSLPGMLFLDTPQPRHGLLYPCGIWPSGAGLGGMG